MLDGFSYFEFYILVLQVDTSLHAHKIECFVFCFFSDLCGSFVVLWANVVTSCNWWHKFITTRIGAWPLDRFNFLFIYSCYCGVRPIQYFGRRLIFSQQGLLTPTLGTSTGHQSWLGVATTRIADLRVRAPGFATTSTTFPAHQIRCVGHHRRHLLRPAGLLLHRRTVFHHSYTTNNNTSISDMIKNMHAYKRTTKRHSTTNRWCNTYLGPGDAGRQRGGPREPWWEGVTSTSLVWPWLSSSLTSTLLHKVYIDAKIMATYNGGESEETVWLC